jgi:hypothetical protein
MNNDIRVCIPRIVQNDQAADAAAYAIAENPRNAPFLPRRIGTHASGDFELALFTGKKWKPGRTLDIYFMDGLDAVQTKVEKIARTWCEYANIKMNFTTDHDAHIRITFKQRGSWSYIGTDCGYIERWKPTMNFGWLEPDTNDIDYESVVTHEVGHALGCIHEHQSPNVSIPWNKEAVYAYYAGPPNNWSKDKVDINLLRPYSRTMTNASEFDPKSIMIYSIPNAHTLGDFEIPWTTKLSELDKSFIAEQYPGGDAGLPVLEVGAPAIEADIGTDREEDRFQFEVRKWSTYSIETSGETDVVMSLFGPGSETHWLAEDDDGGRGLNAKILTFLSPGIYYIAVRHYRSTGLGKYKIAVLNEG